MCGSGLSPAGRGFDEARIVAARFLVCKLVEVRCPKSNSHLGMFISRGIARQMNRESLGEVRCDLQIRESPSCKWHLSESFIGEWGRAVLQQDLHRSRDSHSQRGSTPGGVGPLEARERKRFENKRGSVHARCTDGSAAGLPVCLRKLLQSAV